MMYFKAEFHKKGLNYLSLTINEVGAKSSKKTYASLGPDQARALIEFLRPFARQKKVIIEVKGGVATAIKQPVDIKVKIKDRD